jgi:hypothetical protein
MIALLDTVIYVYSYVHSGFEIQCSMLSYPLDSDKKSDIIILSWILFVSVWVDTSLLQCVPCSVYLIFLLLYDVGFFFHFIYLVLCKRWMTISFQCFGKFTNIIFINTLSMTLTYISSPLLMHMIYRLSLLIIS